MNSTRRRRARRETVACRYFRITIYSLEDKVTLVNMPFWIVRLLTYLLIINSQLEQGSDVQQITYYFE